MALKLDDLISKKKDSLQILDLSKSIVNSKEELRRLLEKVPEFKIKPEKVRIFSCLQYCILIKFLGAHLCTYFARKMVRIMTFPTTYLLPWTPRGPRSRVSR